MCRAIKRGDEGIVNVVLLTGSSKFMVDPAPEWLCRNCDDLGNKFTAYDAEPVFSVEETGWIENDLRKTMLPQTLLTDTGHVYSLKLKHRQPISVPHRVTYFYATDYHPVLPCAEKVIFRVSAQRSSTSSTVNSSHPFFHRSICTGPPAGPV
uniref:Uncharacterized protein n=1 Tax=Klebsiella pneumoniae TaxID=573 RepID=A0A8B0STM9_KLEPN|nr:hypothetical protein [Klebsiella pneumoniae]